jgi:hypothetical protein
MFDEGIKGQLNGYPGVEYDHLSAVSQHGEALVAVEKAGYRCPPCGSDDFSFVKQS